MLKISPLNKFISQETNLINNLNNKTLLNYQLAKTAEVVAYTQENSPFYKNKFKNIKPENINSLETLNSLPFTTNLDLINNTWGFLCVSQTEVSRIISLFSTGTLAPSKRFFFTEKDLNLCTNFFTWGLKPMVLKNEKAALFLGPNTVGGTVNLLTKALKRLKVECFIFPFQPVENNLILNNINFMVGFPLYLLQLAKTQPHLRPKAVLFCSDYIPKSIKKLVAKIWHCKIFSHYGSTESGLGGAVDCGFGNGYHLWGQNLLFEIINPKTNLPAQNNEWGEIVFTVLGRKAMPLIRYKSGDISRFINSPCQCGCNLTRLDDICGRYANYIKLYNGEDISIHILDEILFSIFEVFDYQAFIINKSVLKLKINLFKNINLVTLKKLIEEKLIEEKLILKIEIEIVPNYLFKLGSKRIIYEKHI